jgi:hypothetical protein
MVQFTEAPLSCHLPLMAIRPDKPTPSTIQRPLSLAVMDLHRALLQAQARETGLAGNPYKLLGAVMEDPRFAWLRAFSDLIVAMDEAGARGELPEAAALAPFVEAVRALIAPGTEAAARIADLAPTTPDIAAAAAKTQAALAEFTQ